MRLKISTFTIMMLALNTAMASTAHSSIKTIQIYAHRGARSFSPENTLPAYQTGLAVGTDWVDMDVVLTKDGEVLVSHDPLLNPDIVRSTNGSFIAKNKEALSQLSPSDLSLYVPKYAVKNLTLAELKKFDVGRLNPSGAYSQFFPDQVPVDGTRMPTLREVVRWVNDRTNSKTGFQIEMKTDPAHPEISADPSVFAAAVYKILREEKIVERSEIQAFDFRCLKSLQGLDPKVRTAYLTSRENEPGGADDFFSQDLKISALWTGGPTPAQYGGSIPKMVKAMGGFAWEPEDAELTEAKLHEAHSLGLKVVVWTWPEKQGRAFDSKLVTKMIDWGVDGIISDDPGRLASMFAARGIPVPPRFPVP